ncbi:hypothetical protein O181_018709 [Austropuccinia psidii MF-1]|uniref:Uncharacterized protein n=1 Tax=Austropuccinia psidii MF-1 TaxID=1389203 RepID=A0A9Q3C5R3_9BASI|nr:hypothetical protein [Austropuccinia psidii MF-1]
MRQELFNLLYTYKNSLASYSKPLGTIRENKVDITFNIDRPYPPLIRIQAYPERPRDTKAFEKEIQESMKLGFLRKLSYNEEVEVKPPVIIALHNDKSRRAGDL